MAGILASAAREIRSWPRRRLFWWLMVLAPLAGAGLLALILGTGTPRGLPVALCDMDHSSLSRELIHRIEATPSIRVTNVVSSPEQGASLLRSGRVYAFILIPRDFERDMLRRRPVRPVAYLEGQHMVTAGVLSRDLTDLGMDFWHEQDVRLRELTGVPASSAALQSSTVSLDLRPVANPTSNYRVFLLPGLIPALLQLTMTIMTVCSLARLAGTSPLEEPDREQDVPGAKETLGVLFALAGWFWLLGLGMAGTLAIRGDLVLRGDPLAFGLAWLLFSLSSTALGALLFGLTDNAIQSLGVASAFSSPALAFAGLLFPVLSMPFLGRLWAVFLPLTHLMDISVRTGQLGSPAMARISSFAALGLLALVYGAAGLPLTVIRIRRGRKKDSRADAPPRITPGELPSTDGGRP